MKKLNKEFEEADKKKDISKSYGKTENYLKDKIARIKKASELNNIYDKIL